MPSIDATCLQTACSRVRQGWARDPRQSFARWGLRLKDPQNRPSVDPNCELFPQGPIIPVPPSTSPYRPVGICGNNWAVSPYRDAKRKPPNQRVRGLLFPLFRWWLCSMTMPKQHQAVLGSTKTRVQKPVSAIPTLSRSFIAAPFQLGLVRLSVLSTLPPNPSACPRSGVWDKPWDKFANYFETASPQFHFCPGDKNSKALRRIIARNGCQKGRFSSLAPVWRSES